jgi:hypothetical protein
MVSGCGSLEPAVGDATRNAGARLSAVLENIHDTGDVAP